MKTGQGGSIRRDLGRLFEGQSVAGMGEAQLLARFVERGDEPAFAALVARHGPMVLGVCRRLLADPLDVEDAFQATFLIFIRRAGSIQGRDRLAPWLFGVARKVACRTRTDQARRKARESSGAEAIAMARDDPDRELNQALLDEIDRLPASLREAILLCCVEGLSYHEAATRLQSTPPAIRGRLARARERLRERLNRRGFAPSVGLSGWLGGGAAKVAVPAKLLMITQLARAGTFPASVEILAAGVIRTMIVTHSKLLAVALLACGVAGTGAGVYAQRQGPGDAPVHNPEVSSTEVPSVEAAVTSATSVVDQPIPNHVWETSFDGGNTWVKGPQPPSAALDHEEFSKDGGATWVKETQGQWHPLIRGVDSNGQVVFLQRNSKQPNAEGRIAQRLEGELRNRLAVLNEIAADQKPDADRLGQLEQKLDRILNALEGNGGFRPAPRNPVTRATSPAARSAPARVAAPAPPAVPASPMTSDSSALPGLPMARDPFERDPTSGRPVGVGGTDGRRLIAGGETRPKSARSLPPATSNEAESRIDALEQKVNRIEAQLAAVMRKLQMGEARGGSADDGPTIPPPGVRGGTRRTAPPRAVSPPPRDEAAAVEPDELQPIPPKPPAPPATPESVTLPGADPLERS